jgi:predicted ATPase
VRHTPESPEVFLTDVGSGVSQVLSVLVQCYYAPEGSTIVLELPELHLHPSVQSGLADIFIDAYQKRRVQIIFESHSEHLLRRLQRRIAEETPEISPTTVNLYFCSLENGESKLEPLQLDEYGNIHNYPKDFFGDRFEEMAAMTEAGIERRAKKALKST